MTRAHPNDQPYASERVLAAAATQGNERNASRAPTDNQAVANG
jgi:hypothetical protein